MIGTHMLKNLRVNGIVGVPKITPTIVGSPEAFKGSWMT